MAVLDGSTMPLTAEGPLGRIPGQVFAQEAVPGLIWAYRFREGLPAESLEPGDVPAALTAEDGWLWLHFSLTDALARTWIGELEPLPEAARALFRAAEERLSIEESDGAIYGVFVDFQREFDRPTEEIGRLRFALTERLVISGRRHALRAVEEIRQALHEGLEVPAAGRLIEGIVDRFCDAAARLSAGMTDQLDGIEDRVVVGQAQSERKRLMPVRRTAVRLHRQLSSLAGVFHNWEDRDTDTRASSLHIATGRLAKRLEALDHDLVIVQDRARLLQDEIAAKLAEDTNTSLRALSILTAVLLPGSLVAGIFGMNTKDLPLVDTDGGFLIAMTVMIAATALFYWLLRRLGAGL